MIDSNISPKISAKKLIFDLDNTLLFMPDDWSKAFDDFVDRFNLTFSLDEFCLTIAEMEKLNAGNLITKELFIANIRKKITPKFDSKMFDDFLEGYAKIPLIYVDVIQDILTYLSNKYELIAYTNWFTDNQILRLQLNGMEQYFSKVWGWDALPAKPSRKGLAEIVGDNDARNYIFIGDNLECDIKLPDSIGMGTVFLNQKNLTQSQFREIKNIDELKNIL